MLTTKPTLKKIKIDEKLKKKWEYLCSIGKDVHVAISGDEGDGKSTLGAYLIKKVFKLDLWQNMVYTDNPKEFYDKYENAEVAMCFDEALDLFNRLDWAKTDLKELVKKFRRDVRKEKNMIWFYNVQLFRDLHPYWRTHRIRWWLEMTPREWFKDGCNWVFVFSRQRVPFITGRRDVWLLDELEKAWMKSMRHGKIIKHAYVAMLRRHPFYEGEFRMRKRITEVYREYQKRREEAIEEYKKDAVEDIQNESERTKAWKIRVLDLLKLMYVEGEYLSREELAKRWGVTRSTIDHLVKEARDMNI